VPTQKAFHRVVYFATGSPAEVATDLERLQLGRSSSDLCLVVPAGRSRQLTQALPFRPAKIVVYRSWLSALLWLRLRVFLGFWGCPEVICLSGREHFRFLKFLALTLRGRVIFSPRDGPRVPLSPFDLFSIWWRHTLDQREACRAHLPVGVLGSASAYYLEVIAPVLRARYPSAPLHAWLRPATANRAASLFDSVQLLPPGWTGAALALLRASRDRRYQRWIVPCTQEPYLGLKVLAFLCPLRRRQIYNELGDGFAVRDLRTLWGHLRWRLRDQLGFQILAGTAGRSALGRCLHLSLYALRLLGAIPVLCRALVRDGRPARSLQRQAAATNRPAGDLTGNEELQALRMPLARSNPVDRLPGLPGDGEGSNPIG
jgi:hypothetical protein